MRIRLAAIAALLVVCLVPSAAASQEVVEVRVREIRFENDGIELVGTLHAPANAERGPAIVVTHGSGPGTRDTPLYAQFADLMPALGFSVFVFDRRGAGESGGRREGASYGDLAGDAVAAMRAIADEDEVDPAKIGLWGLSQGGWIAMEAGAMSDPAFVISASAPLTTPGEQMQVLAYNFVRREGHGEAAAERAREARRTYDRYHRGEIDHETAGAALAEVEDEPWYEHAFLPAAEDLTTDLESSTYVHEVDYDPTVALRELDAPLLYILGAEDVAIPVDRSLEILAELPPDEDRTVVVVPGADHVLRLGDGDDDDDEDDGEAVISDAPGYFLAIGHWLGALGLGDPDPAP